MVLQENKPTGTPILAAIIGMLFPSLSAPNSPAKQRHKATAAMEIEIITIPVPQAFRGLAKFNSLFKECVCVCVCGVCVCDMLRVCTVVNLQYLWFGILHQDHMRILAQCQLQGLFLKSFCSWTHTFTMYYCFYLCKKKTQIIHLEKMIELLYNSE